MLSGVFVFYEYGAHLDLHILTHSFPTRRTSAVEAARPGRHSMIALVLADLAAEEPVGIRGVAEDHRHQHERSDQQEEQALVRRGGLLDRQHRDRKSTRLNSSH